MTDRPSLEITDPVATRKALTFFKVMALIVGVGLLVLVVELYFEYLTDLKDERNPLGWWPIPHGFIFMVYMAATIHLGFKAAWSLLRMVLVILAGCVPFLSFVVERKVAADVEADLEKLQGDSDRSAAQ